MKKSLNTENLKKHSAVLSYPGKYALTSLFQKKITTPFWIPPRVTVVLLFLMIVLNLKFELSSASDRCQ